MASAKLQSTPKIGLFTGTFDPVTKGHLDIIKRGAKLFDKLYVGVFDNPNKQPLFSMEERLGLLKENLVDLSDGISPVENIEVIVHERDLTVNIARELGVTAILRSIRGAEDLSYEANMIYFNHQMTGVETVLLVAEPELSMISSSRVKELAGFHVDIAKFVPDNVNQALQKKFKR